MMFRAKEFCEMQSALTRWSLSHLLNLYQRIFFWPSFPTFCCAPFFPSILPYPAGWTSIIHWFLQQICIEHLVGTRAAPRIKTTHAFFGETIRFLKAGICFSYSWRKGVPMYFSKPGKLVSSLLAECLTYSMCLWNWTEACTFSESMPCLLMLPSSKGRARGVKKPTDHSLPRHAYDEQ